MRRLSTAVALFSHELEQHRTVSDVVDRVHAIATKEAGLSLYAIWRVSDDPTDLQQIEQNRHVFIHRDAPRRYRDEHIKMTARYGISALSRMAARKPLPFTFTECSRAMAPARRSDGAGRASRWAFELAHKHGMRDGFICPVGRWRVMLYSKHVIVLPVSSSLRGLLATISALAVSKMEELTTRRKRNGNGNKLAPGPRLSARELTVLQALSSGQRLEHIASSLDIDESTVRTFMRRAMKKLNAKTHTQAVVIAVKQMLIQ